MTKTTIHPDDTPNNATDNPFSETVYDAAGRVEATIDENGNLTTCGYDDADRRTRRDEREERNDDDGV